MKQSDPDTDKVLSSSTSVRVNASSVQSEPAFMIMTGALSFKNAKARSKKSLAACCCFCCWLVAPPAAAVEPAEVSTLGGKDCNGLGTGVGLGSFGI